MINTLRHAALFELGFRPFFLLAGVHAIVSMLLWLAQLHLGQPVSAYAGVATHSHEILFGYTAAVIAGFLLTAVRNWTGQPTLSGVPLLLLCLLWLAGRLLPWLSDNLLLCASVDLLFLPVLVASLIGPLWRGNKPQQFLLLVILIALWGFNLWFHLGMLGYASGLAVVAPAIAVFMVILLIVIISGRVMPMFTRNGLQREGIDHQPVTRTWLERALIPALLAWLIARLLTDSLWLEGGLALLCFLLSGLRLAGWFHPAVLRVPLLWILYSGYGWTTLGFLLSALASAGLVVPSLALHAFTAGGIGLMTLGMMARVSLGHTGRPLLAGGAITCAFWLLNVAVLLRVAVPLLDFERYSLWLQLSGLGWILAFAIFVWVYAPMLCSPRVDQD